MGDTPGWGGAVAGIAEGVGALLPTPSPDAPARGGGAALASGRRCAMPGMQAEPLGL